MFRSADDIVALYDDRKRRLGPVHAQMRRVREMSNGDLVIPVSELDQLASNGAANLLILGLEQMSMRVGSTMPSPYFPPVRASLVAKEKARSRREALLSIWDANNVAMKLRRRSRHLLGYSNSPVYISPDFERKVARWRVINPLDTYPAPLDDPDEMIPADCIISMTRTERWLREHYPEAMLTVKATCRPDDTYTVLNYTDAEQVVLVVLGKTDAEIEAANPTVSEQMRNRYSHLALERIPNRTGQPLVIIPERFTLDQPHGQFDGMIPMFLSRAKLHALNEIAVQRGVFPNEWLVARPNETPEIIQMADGLSGEMGVVKGGDIATQQLNPGYKTDIMIDRIERQERLEAGVPAEMGGEAASTVRTARRGEQIIGATIDFRVQEAQELLATSLLHEDHLAFAIEKAYWGNMPKSFLVPGRKVAGEKSYLPNEMWATTKHYVNYPATGSDVNNLVIGLGQRLGTGLISRESAREADPLIEDPELEKDRIVAEGIEQALLSSIMQQAAMPDGPYQPRDLARIVELVTERDVPLFKAVEKADEEARERQSAEMEEGSPEAMAGLAMPGMGAEAGTAVPPVEPSVSNLAQLLGQLRRPVAVGQAMNEG
jgi:hypothetical protein